MIRWGPEIEWGSATGSVNAREAALHVESAALRPTSWEGRLISYQSWLHSQAHVSYHYHYFWIIQYAIRGTHSLVAWRWQYHHQGQLKHVTTVSRPCHCKKAEVLLAVLRLAIWHLIVITPCFIITIFPINRIAPITANQQGEKLPDHRQNYPLSPV